MLTVLTDQRGKLSISARGATRTKSRTAAACQPMAYAELTLSSSRERYYLREAATLELFSGLTADLKQYALGCYFLELLEATCPEEQPEPEILSLGLNALWLLAGGKKAPLLVKSVFELRLLSLLGYQPELGQCACCGKAEPDAPSFDLRGGALYCGDCALREAQRPVRVDAGVLQALRHIVGALPERAFAFSLEQDGLKRVSRLAEQYVREQLERGFSTLDYYKSIGY